MPHIEPAPRYSRPIPPSRLAPPPARRPSLDDALADLAHQVATGLRLPRVIAALSCAIERERVDHMTAIGFGLGAVAIALTIVVTASH